MAKYDNSDYQCACAVRYAGKHCEIGILHYYQVSDRRIGYSTFYNTKSFNFSL